ncbi:PAS domain S-box protein, partial [bacterium]
RFHNLLDDVPAHIVVLKGPELRYEFGNRAFRQFIGGDEVAGKLAGEVWNVPDDHRALLRSVIDTGQSVKGQETPVPLPTQPGQTGYFDFAFQTLKDPDGSIPGVYVYSADVTEKVMARLALSEERHRLDKTLATAEIATFDWDPRADKVFANPLLQRFFGVTAEDATGGHISRYLDAIHEGDREAVAQAIQNTLATGERYEIEYRVLDAQGEERWVLARGDATLSETGPTRLSGILLDITARKTAEAERERLLMQVEIERSRLEQAFDETPTFICLLDGPDLVFRYANEPYYSLIGFREVIGKPLAEALPEIAAQGFPQILRGVMETGENWMADEVAVAIQRKPGALLEERILNLRYVPVRDADGSISGVYSHAFDVTDQVNARRKLAESEERFRIVAQATRDAVWDWDLRDDSVWWNEGISDLFGHSRESVEPTAAWWATNIHPEDRERVGASIHDAIDHGRSNWQDEYRYAKADGGYLIVEDRGYAVFDEAGRPVRMVGAMTDVTKVREEAARLAFLRDLTETMSNLREPGALLTAAERMLAEYLDVSRCAYAEVDENGNNFTLWDWSRDLPSISGTYALSSFGSRTEDELKAGRTLVIRDVNGELDGDGEPFRLLGIQSLIACPLIKHGRLSAMVGIHNKSPRDWSEDEVNLLHQVADRMWAEIERARAETALRQNAEQLQTIFDNAEDDAIILMDADRRILAWNRAAEKICGWSAAEAYGRRSDVLFTQEERASGEPQRKADAAMRDGKILSERWYQRRDGTRFWGSGTMTALLNSDRSVRGFLKVFRDATVKRRELITLEFLQNLTDAVRDLRDPATIIETALRLLGEHMVVDRCAYCEIEADEETAHILGDWRPHMMSIVGTYAVSSWGTPMADDLKAGRTFIADDIDLRLHPADGADLLKDIGIHAVVCAPLTKSGRLAGALAVHNAAIREWNDEEIELVEMVADRLWAEIERARAEKNLLALNEELEERVTDRTAQLEAAIKESEAFNYSISHDLRAPLRSIVATSRILLEDTEGQIDAESRGLLERQAHNASRLGVLIDELLRLSRLGRVEVHRSDIDMSELVEEFVAEMGRANMTHGCHFEIEPGMQGRGDARLVRLVYSNLLENACKFSPEGGRIWVGHRRRGEDDVFSVRDEGVGFDMAYAHKLFLPFERLVTEAEFPGTGIGLANVDRIIRRHGGHVWAESEPGKGATFFFTLS